jgi:hypothetical protein
LRFDFRLALGDGHRERLDQRLRERKLASQIRAHVPGVLLLRGHRVAKRLGLDLEHGARILKFPQLRLQAPDGELALLHLARAGGNLRLGGGVMRLEGGDRARALRRVTFLGGHLDVRPRASS